MDPLGYRRVEQTVGSSGSRRSPLIRQAGDLETVIAAGRTDLAQAYRLVYRKYVEHGFVGQRRDGMVYQLRFGLPTTRTVVSKSAADAVVGTLTVVGDNPLGLTIERTYADEVAELREKGRRLAEVTCLAIDSTCNSRGRSVFYSLTQFLFQYAQWRGFDDLVLAIHPRHVAFYERCFRVIPFGPKRPYEVVRGHPAIACRIDVRDAVRRVDDEILDWYVNRRIPQSEFQRPPISIADHAYFSYVVGLHLTPDFPAHPYAA